MNLVVLDCTQRFSRNSFLKNTHIYTHTHTQVHAEINIDVHAMG